MYRIECEYLGVTVARNSDDLCNIDDTIREITDSEEWGPRFKCDGDTLLDGHGSHVRFDNYRAWRTEWAVETGILAGIATGCSGYGQRLLDTCNQLLAEHGTLTETDAWADDFDLNGVNADLLQQIDRATWTITGADTAPSNANYAPGLQFRMRYLDTIELVNEADQAQETYRVIHCYNDDEFEAWAQGESFAATLDGDENAYIKVNVATTPGEREYEVMTITAANEWLGDVPDYRRA